MMIARPPCRDCLPPEMPRRARIWWVRRQAAAAQTHLGRSRREPGAVAPLHCSRASLDLIRLRALSALWGGAGLRPQGNDSIVDDAHEIVVAIKAENLPLDVNFFRSQPRIAMSQQRLENIWRELRTRFRGTGRNAVKVREAASMAATARWIWASAGTRNESRGLHRRLDRPELDGNQARRIAVGGLDTVWTEVDQRDLRAIAS